MRINRGLLFWGLGFITAGAVALLIQQNVLDRETMAGAWRLWPLILVAIGFSLIVSRTNLAPLGTVVAALVIGTIVGTAIAVGPGFGTGCGDTGSDPSLATQNGTFGADSASIDWQLTCGRVSVTTTDGTGWTARTGSTGNEPPRVTGEGDLLKIDSASNNGGWFTEGRDRWEIVLPRTPRYDADIHANAGRLDLDLQGARFAALDIQPNAADLHFRLDGASIDSFDLQLNAGSAQLTVSGATTLSGSIQLNAGSVELCAPSGTALRITASGTFFGADLEGNGLTHTGDTWESANYASAQQRITLAVRGNVGSFKLNPSGGCS